jgi:hypothetical protein
MWRQEHTPALSFREFLRAKAEELGIRDRHRRRNEWLGALHRLADQLQDWLRQSDPEGLLDIEPYEVARSEHKLGNYNAPALKIRFGPRGVDIVPMSRDVISTVFDVATGPSTSLMAEATPFAGRVDVTDGFRKFNLFRQIRDDEDHWWVRDEHDRFTPLNSDSWERILQVLLS